MAASSFKRSLITSRPAKYESFLAGNSFWDPYGYESIATANGSGLYSYISFGSIPQTYSSLQIRAIVRETTTIAQGYPIYMTFNNSSSAYSDHALQTTGGGGSSVTTNSTVSGSSITFPQVTCTIASASNNVGVIIIDIHDYASTSKNTTVRAHAGYSDGTSSSVSVNSGAWHNTDPVSFIKFETLGAANWQTETRFALYGIKAKVD